ncbi:hypothetical protein ACFVXE_26285 [Streptomyces sp. NPDC058231]|uniref:hypothetical protein n=1 Tax=Streptomyces sp. NPDC058231 TaxID=3346392 RepID=UPI0036ED7FDF
MSASASAPAAAVTADTADRNLQQTTHLAHQEIVELLLAAGATPGLPDGDGVTALEHAERRGFEEIAALLRNRDPR